MATVESSSSFKTKSYEKPKTMTPTNMSDIINRLVGVPQPNTIFVLPKIVCYKSNGKGNKAKSSPIDRKE